VSQNWFEFILKFLHFIDSCTVDSYAGLQNYTGFNQFWKSWIRILSLLTYHPKTSVLMNPPHSGKVACESRNIYPWRQPNL
jgi:hypothetical protein